MEAQAGQTGAGEESPIPPHADPAGQADACVSEEARVLALALGAAVNLAEARAVFRRQVKSLWPHAEVYFATVDPEQPRFLMLREDGTRVPKSGHHFSLDQFFATPGRSHVYAQRIVKDREVLGELAAGATHEGLLTYSLAVPVYRKGLLRAAAALISDRGFDWGKEDVERLSRLGGVFLDGFEKVRCSATQAAAPRATARAVTAGIPSAEKAEILRELLAVHSAMDRVGAALLQPLDVIEAACRELAPVFAGFHFTIAVHYPESRLFVVHAPGCEPRRLACDQAIEGRFLQFADEDVLAVEDYELWPAASPSNAQPIGDKRHRSGLFTAARLQGTLVGVMALQAPEPVAWGAREIELLRAAARGVAVTYYNAMVCDNLTYSCREAYRRIDDLRHEMESWKRKAQHIEIAVGITRSIPPCRRPDDLMAHVQSTLRERWPDCRLTILRYIAEQNGFKSHSPTGDGCQDVRPARHCIQNLFLNNVPVTQIVCDLPQEIASYRELDPALVSECEMEGFHSFCIAPISIGDRLWGAITLQSREPRGCSPRVDLLCEIARAVGHSIRMIEQQAQRSDGTSSAQPA